MSLKSDKKGLTLVELVIAASVISILTILIFSYLVDKIAANAIANARSDLQQQTRLTLQVINRDIKHGAFVEQSNRWPDEHSPTSPDNDYGWQSNNTTLILAQPVQDTNGNVLFEDQLGYVSYKDNHIYFVNNGTLYKRTLAADVPNNREVTTCPSGTAGCNQDAELVKNVTNFTLTYYDSNDQAVTPDQARSVLVQLSIQKEVFSKTISYEYSERSVLRNE